MLVHGFGISSSYFVPLAERLAPDLNVYAPDLPGHGRSETPPSALDVPGFAIALREWLAATGIDRTAVVGHSMGSQIAAELAARYSDVVERLVLIGATLDEEARTLRRVLPRFIAGAGCERWSMAPLLLRDYLRMGWRLIDEFGALTAYPIESALPRITVPVLFVRGEHDAIAPQHWIEKLARRTPNASAAVVPGGGHAVQYTLADETAAVVAPFLRACSPRPA